MNRRKKKLDDEELMSRNHEKVVKSWSSVHYIVEGLDGLAKEVKVASHVHCDRSKLLNGLAELLLEHRDNLDLSRIVDHRSLMDELAAAFRKK